MQCKDCKASECYGCGQCECPNMQWIKCSEKLPEIGKTCLLYITYPKGTMLNCLAHPLERTNIFLGGRIYTGDFFLCLDQINYKQIEHVTHWMPLPTPPKD